MEKLAENARVCLDTKGAVVTHNPAAANRALELLGKEMGLFKESGPSAEVDPMRGTT